MRKVLLSLVFMGNAAWPLSVMATQDMTSDTAAQNAEVQAIERESRATPIPTSTPTPAPVVDVPTEPQRGEDSISITKTITTPSSDPREDVKVREKVKRKKEYINSVGGDAIPALPLDIKTVGDIVYVTGGVGDEELAMLKEKASDFNVQVLLSSTSGGYLGGAMVRILDDKDAELVLEENAGPYFYANLKPGKYTLDITAPQGGIKKVPIHVPTSGTIHPNVVFTE